MENGTVWGSEDLEQSIKMSELSWIWFIQQKQQKWEKNREEREARRKDID